MQRVAKRVSKATGKNSLRAFEKLTEVVDGHVRIANDPPVLVRMADILGEQSDYDLTGQIERWLRMYGRSLQRDRRHLLESFRVVEGQRLMQTASDIFLGWDRIPNAAGEEHDFYVRQLWDGKLSLIHI